MPFSRSIEAFADALLDPSRPAPDNTAGREGRPDNLRFSVYRNNIAVSLIAAVEARYPVARRLVGDAFFRGMTRAFVACNKPQSPVILHYGSSFPDFVAEFEPARDLAYLPDLARLENAWVEAYHSAESETAGVEALAVVNPDSLPGLRLEFHPAARLVRSEHPIGSIWARHQEQDEVRAPEVWRAEEILVTRPHADVRVQILPPGGFPFARALRDHASLAEAAEAAGDVDNFDPGLHLVGLIEAGAISRLEY